MLHAADDDEQAQEKADGGPLDIVDDLFEVGARYEQDDGGSSQRDDAGFQVQRTVSHEGNRDDDDHGDAHLEQERVLDRLALVKLHHVLHILLLNMQLAAVHELENDDDYHHHHDDGRRVVANEVEERQTRSRTDHDVGRIADERGRAAHVRRQNLDEQERRGIDLQRTAQHDGHRADKQNGRDVIEERGEHGGDDGEHDHDLPGVALAKLRRLNSHELEKTRQLHHAHEHHHAAKDGKRVEVNRFERGIETRENLEGAARNAADGRHDEQHDRTCERRHSTMDFLRHHQGHDDHEDDYRQNLCSC